MKQGKTKDKKCRRCQQVKDISEFRLTAKGYGWPTCRVCEKIERQELLDAGLCNRCKQSNSNGKSNCDGCLSNRRKNQEAYHNRLLAKNLCITCGKNPIDETKKLRCSHCYEKSKKSANSKNFDIKRLCVEYKGGKCIRCGYNEFQSGLQFHHLDPRQKEFNIATKKSLSFDALKSELDKCILLCANCHFSFHGVEWSIEESRELLRSLNQQEFNALVEAHCKEAARVVGRTRTTWPTQINSEEMKKETR